MLRPEEFIFLGDEGNLFETITNYQESVRKAGLTPKDGDKKK